MTSLRLYILRRILQGVPLILGVILLNFTIIHLAPGDPTYLLAGELASPEYRQEVRESLGLDKPIWEQIIIYMSTVLRGDLGYSFTYKAPVLVVIMEKVPATALLVGSALILAIILGVVLGVNAGRRPYSTFDNATTVFSVFGYSVPSFWLGIMLILIFAIYLEWLPVAGMSSVGKEMAGPIEYTVDVLSHLLLPALVLAVWHLARFARLTRASILEELSKDYITTARAKGCTEMAVLYAHALKNAMLPVVTMIGLSLPFIFTGALLTETIFSWPGLGRLMYDAMIMRDFPLIMGIFIIVSVSVVIANLVTDIVYAYLDPRIRYA